MDFLWAKDVPAPEFSTLDGNQSTDVLVIGGGIVGVLCAMRLKEAGVRYLLVEGRKIGGGITKGTTAVLTAQHDTLYQDMIKKHGKGNAGLYLYVNLQAVERFRELAKCIPCDFEERPSIVYALHDRVLMEREVKAVRSLGFDAEFTTETPLPYFPTAKEKYAWANQDCISLDSVPYIGPYNAGLPDVYVAAGFNLWGMTSSMVASEILTDMVLGRDSRFAPAFVPDRSMLTGQICTTLLDFVTLITKRCFHLGCALKWNGAEHSWGCPCHGSRFEAHGRIIDGPAMKDSHVE